MLNPCGLLAAVALAGGVADPCGADRHGTGLHATGLHAVAYITDSLSHGAVGDGFLSLDEAIRLHNGQLSLALLSPAELAQLSLIPGTGSTTDVTWIDIDGTSTPIITIERDLSPILDTTFGLLIKGYNESPVFDFSGPNITRGLLAPANSLALENLILSGGPCGVDVTQTDVAGQSGATLRNVRFENHSQFGLRVRALTANAVGRVILEDCSFDNVPTAMQFDETGTGRTSIFEARNVTVRGAATGIDIVLGAGGTGRYLLDRFEVEASGSGLRFQRPAGADRQAVIESTMVRIRAPLCASIDGAPTGLGVVILRLWDLRATPGGTALALGAPGDRIAGSIDDATLEGAVTIGAGAGPTPLTLANLRSSNCSVTLAGSAAQPFAVSFSRFDACTVQNQGTGTLTFRDSCFIGGSLIGTAAAPIATIDSYVSGSLAHVQQTNALGTPQLGSMSITPERVLVGGPITLRADLPPGLAGVLLVGTTDPEPALLPQPIHLYSIPALTVALPGVYRGQQSLTLTIPNQFWLAGFEFIAQIAVVPDPGTTAPPIQLPPGRRFVIRL